MLQSPTPTDVSLGGILQITTLNTKIGNLLMNRFIISLFIMVLSLFSLVACGGIDADVHDAVVIEKDAAQASVVQLKRENTGISNTLRNMRAELTEAEAAIQGLRAVYPPRRFKDRLEIEAWLRNDDISERPTTFSAEAWLSTALEQQARALEDGYIVSAEYVFVGGADYQVWLSAVAENSNYFSWDPESDEIMFGGNINRLPTDY